MESERDKNVVDVEAQPVPIAVPAEPVQPATTVVRVYEIPVSHQHDNEPDDPNSHMLPCAIVGCAFSWIPIIGCITWAINLDAPRRTPRKFWSTAACAVAMTFVLLTLIFGSAGNAY